MLTPGVARKSLETVRVVIIGAGASGIAAAIKLLAAGCRNLLILEAENRIGGRIYTLPFGDNVIDLGAQWCHGEKNNVVYETVKQCGVNLLDSTGAVYDDYKCIRSNKEILDDKLAGRLKEIAFNTLQNTEDSLREYEGSLGCYLTARYWSEVNKLDTSINRIVAKEFLQNFKKFVSSLEGADHLDEVSGKGHLDYWECEGDLLLNWKSKGYAAFLEILMKSDSEMPWGVLEKHILLNHRVQNIDWLHENSIKIRCANGEIIEAEHVICTVSLGVLKEMHTTLFTPCLPQQKVFAIDGLNLGTVDKIFLEFKDILGPQTWSGMCFLWLEEDLQELRYSQHFWLESVLGFYRVSHQPRLLQGWIIGPHARYMEYLTEEEVLTGLLWLLRKFLNFPIPEPLNFKRTNWYSNISFRGSYTFRSLYTEELRTGAWDLAAPVTDIKGKPKLLFAGESTHNHYYSTVHGAVESGWREADRLLDFYKCLPAHL